MKPNPNHHKGLSVPQQIKFRPVVKQAWMRHCVIWDQDHKDKAAERAWYEKELVAATGHHSTTEIWVTPDTFHDLLLHFATLANDAQLMASLAIEDERRMRFLITRCLDELAFLECRSVDWSYAVATFKQMRLPLTLDETPLPYLEKVFMALDTHVRQLLRERNKQMATAMTRYELRQAAANQKLLEAAYA